MPDIRQKLSCALCIFLLLWPSIAGASAGEAGDPIYPFAPGRVVLSSENVSLDISNRSLGYFMIRHRGSEARLKVIVTRGDTVYQYDLDNRGAYVAFPFNMGSGEYTIGVYEQAPYDPNCYFRIFEEAVHVYMPDMLSVYLTANQYVWFTEDSDAVRKAQELCEDLSETHQKITTLYEYVNRNILFDYIKYVTVKTSYLPNVDETLASGRGICFDYAVLLAAMLRSQGIPTELVIGELGSTNPPIQHAWNKVYLDGTWLLVDPTYRSENAKQSDYVEKRVY